MIPRSVKAPTIPIPFHKLLEVVAVIDPDDAETKALIDHIKAENYDVEVTDRFDRDVSEDASVGAYVVLVDGDRLEPARALARAVRDVGFQTPIWALADSQRISDVAVLGGLGEVEGFIYLGQQTPAFLRQAGGRERGEVRPHTVAALLRRSRRVRRRGQRRLRLSRPPGRAVLSQIAGRTALLQTLRRSDLPQRPLQCGRGSRRSA
jgi:hypothetical protein